MKTVIVLPVLQLLNIVDTVAPAITCPATQTQSLGAGCVVALANYTSLATTSDNCAVYS